MKRAMISSTSIDLPEHRRQVMEACLREGVFPRAMEHLPARDADAIRVSLEMVDEADLYLGLFAWRYGHIPEGHEVSVTEQEFNRAVQRGIPILVFTIHKEHPLTIEMVETSEVAQKKLQELKERACRGRGRAEFRSPVELRAEVIQAIADLKQREQQAAGAPPVSSFHRPSDIPAAPARYVAHPYTLLQTAEVIGRREELKLLTDWVTRNEQVPKNARLFCVVAIGGMGKSALTWKWFEDIAPNELPNLAGRIWWSFYESDAHYENLLLRALAYATGITEAEARLFTAREREDRLLRVLDEQPYLLVLDGLERILLAYARLDAARLADDDLDEQTANELAGAMALPEETRETYLEKHRLRRCADPRAGEFLRKLTRLRASRVLVSTRLYPAELQTQTAQPLPGCYPLFLRGLTDDDALALWRGFIGGERSGTSEQLLPLLRAIGHYPLLLRALAGEVAEYKPAPGDFERWRQAYPQFNPAGLPLRNARTHVLHFALHGLGEAPRRALHTLAAFRMPTAWDTLWALLVGEGKPCANDRALDAVLTELEDRGLVGWDKPVNRYDLHPIVRGVIWTMVGVQEKQDLYGELNRHFEVLPRDEAQAKTLDDLTPTIELYSSLVGLKRFHDAARLLGARLVTPMLFNLGLGRPMAELLEGLFAGDLDKPSFDLGAEGWAVVMLSLAISHQMIGSPRDAVRLFKRILSLRPEQVVRVNKYAPFISPAFYLSGRLREAENLLLHGLKEVREGGQPDDEGLNLTLLSLVHAARGSMEIAETLVRRSRRLPDAKNVENQFFIDLSAAPKLLWQDRASEAIVVLSSVNLEGMSGVPKAYKIRHYRLQGAAALAMGDLEIAAERLADALNRARAINLIEEELPALTALAKLHLQRKEYDAARDLLEHVWAPAERGPYTLWHVDACNVLAQLERDLGHHNAAVEAAKEAYRLAWCDGPPYAYAPGLARARRHLQEMGVPELELPPFDPAKFEPLPEVELNPSDEFHVDA
jgi:tetratricopeptide (TPR) repeat protein